MKGVDTKLKYIDTSVIVAALDPSDIGRELVTADTEFKKVRGYLEKNIMVNLTILGK